MMIRLTAMAMALMAANAFAVDFGKRPLHEPFLHVFCVTNNTPRTISIRKVRSSCVCLHVLSFPGKVAPDTVGRVAVRVVPDRVGVVKYRCFVELPETAELVRMFTLKGNVTPPRVREQPLFRQIAPVLFTRVLQKPDAGLYVGPDEVLASRSNGAGPTLVDVRPPVGGGGRTIPEALRMAPYQLRTRRHLGRRGVVLIDEGYGSPVLESECRALRAAGFADAAILKGGGPAWRAATCASMERRRDGRLSTISVDAFHALYRKRDLRVVCVGEPNAVARYVLPQAEWVPPAQHALRTLLATCHGRTVVLLTADGQTCRSLLEGCGDTPVGGLYCVGGGWDAYKTYLVRASAMHRRKKGTTRTVTGPRAASATRHRCGRCY